MGMGGGSGASGTIAHVHDNASGQGGPLSSLTLVGTDLLNEITPYRVIDDHIATTTESSFVFAPSTPIDFDTVSEVRIYFDGDTTANLDLLFRINDLSGANYMWSGFDCSTGTYTGVTAFSQTSAEIENALDADFKGFLTIQKSNASSDNEFGGMSYLMRNANARFFREENWSHTSSLTTLSQVEIFTSTSTWEADTRFTVYQLNRS